MTNAPDRPSPRAALLVAALCAAHAPAQPPATARVPAASPFSITQVEGERIDVAHGGRAILRVMIADDTSDKRRADETYKVYAHVMDPTDEAGKRRLTKGAGDKYPHHRGIFVGWSKAVVEGVGPVDTWHMKGNRQSFAGIVAQETDRDSATLAIRVDWKKGDQELLREVRTYVVYAPAEGGAVLIDVASNIKATVGRTVLAGDPEHAGVQFRAHEAVVKNKSARYLFPDGTKPGNKGDKDMPWVAMTFTVDDRPFCVQHMSHPSLPKGNIYSAYRDYGRFGAYFRTTIEKGAEATFRVRFHIAPGGFAEDAAAQMQRRHAEFVAAVR